MKGGEKMQHANNMRDRLMNEFTENYVSSWRLPIRSAPFVQ